MQYAWICIALWDHWNSSPCEVLAARLGDDKCPEKKGNAIFAPHAREAFFPKKLSILREEKIPEKLKIWGLKFWESCKWVPNGGSFSEFAFLRSAFRFLWSKGIFYIEASFFTFKGAFLHWSEVFYIERGISRVFARNQTCRDFGPDFGGKRPFSAAKGCQKGLLPPKGAKGCQKGLLPPKSGQKCLLVWFRAKTREIPLSM